MKVQPVIDPQDTPAVDSYEIPRRIREAMFLRMPASCFPYATATQHMDLDHTIAYRSPARGGPPRQTGVHSLGPLIRFEHRVKPTVDGEYANPNRVSGSGDHPATSTTSDECGDLRPR